MTIRDEFRLRPHFSLSRLHLSYVERIALRFIAAALIVNIVLTAFAFRIHFHPIPIVEATAEGVVAAGTMTTAFMQELKNSGIETQAEKTVSRKLFSAQGTLITLYGDNIQAFEYPTAELAAQDIPQLSEYYYGKSTNSNSWKRTVHIYTKGSLIVFYMGTNAEIISAMNEHASPLAHM